MIYFDARYCSSDGTTPSPSSQWEHPTVTVTKEGAGVPLQNGGPNAKEDQAFPSYVLYFSLLGSVKRLDDSASSSLVVVLPEAADLKRDLEHLIGAKTGLTHRVRIVCQKSGGLCSEDRLETLLALRLVSVVICDEGNEDAQNAAKAASVPTLFIPYAEPGGHASDTRDRIRERASRGFCAVVGGVTAPSPGGAKAVGGAPSSLFPGPLVTPPNGGFGLIDRGVSGYLAHAVTSMSLAQADDELRHDPFAIKRWKVAGSHGDYIATKKYLRVCFSRALEKMLETNYDAAAAGRDHNEWMRSLQYERSLLWPMELDALGGVLETFAAEALLKKRSTGHVERTFLSGLGLGVGRGGEESSGGGGRRENENQKFPWVRGGLAVGSAAALAYVYRKELRVWWKEGIQGVLSGGGPSRSGGSKDSTSL